jgi:hypothetical protein
MSETPIDLAEIRRCYIPDMLEARNRERNQCDCQHRGPDSVSIDGDWLHVAGEKFAAAVAEVERLQAENATLRGHAPWWMAPLRATGKGLRGIEVARAARETIELSLAHPADCPTCRHALGLPEPVDGAGTAGQRLPSDEGTAPRQVDADAGPDLVASAFPMQWEQWPTADDARDGQS